MRPQRSGDRAERRAWVSWSLSAAVVIIAFVAGLLAFNAVRGMVAGWSGGSPRPFGRPVQTSSPGDTVAQQTDFPLLPEETPEPWDGTERVTVLLMGLDYRDWQSDDGPPRTDTMLLSTIDPVSRTAGMLSIPRDLWVEIPGFDQHNRINTAYFLGETYNVPGGGPALAMKTVEHFLGVPIEYYAVIEFSAFERFIDEIGGIDVLVKQRVKISPIGEMSKWLEAKPYHLDGAEALAYARARQTEGGDFDRAERQQQVALAIRDRIMGFDMLPRLVSRSPALYQELRAGVRTNLIDTDAPPEQIIQQLKQVIALARLAMEIPLDEIHKGVIAPPDMVTLATLPDGAQVLKPVPDQIRFLRDEIFTTTGAVGPSVEEETSLAAAQKEAAQIAVLNGAGIEGLAGRTAQFLEGEGLQVVEVGNAKRMDYTKSLIIDYTGNPYTRQYFVELLGISESQILSQLNPSSEVDVALILGADWSVP